MTKIDMVYVKKKKKNIVEHVMQYGRLYECNYACLETFYMVFKAFLKPLLYKMMLYSEMLLICLKTLTLS